MGRIISSFNLQNFSGSLNWLGLSIVLFLLGQYFHVEIEMMNIFIVSSLVCCNVIYLYHIILSLSFLSLSLTDPKADDSRVWTGLIGSSFQNSSFYSRWKNDLKFSRLICFLWIIVLILHYCLYFIFWYIILLIWWFSWVLPVILWI